MREDNGEIIIYSTGDGEVEIDIRFVDETVWLTQQQMAELFKTSRENIVEYIENIYEEGELDRSSTCRDSRQVENEGNRNVSRNVPVYNLDMIITIGYRVKSRTATKFRKWVTKHLKEYLIKGFTMDDNRLKHLGGGTYWQDLLERIRDIRSSEKVMYRQVLDLYTTSADYNPKSNETIAFFKTVQNKLHYAAHGQTAAEVIYARADSEKEFMGFTSFSGKFPTMKDIGVAKNYLTAKELERLNRTVSVFFEVAEMNAMGHKPMYMSDYLDTLENILNATNQKVLDGAGKISQKQAIEKAVSEYCKYQQEKLTPIEEDYLAEIRRIGKTAKEREEENERER